MLLCACPLEGQNPHPPAAANQPASGPVPAQPATHSANANPGPGAALSAKSLNEAEARFTAVLAKQPGNGSALAGMGFIRLQEHNYLGAISYLEQAKLTQPRDTTLAAALESARFRFFLGEGDHSLAANELTAAERRYLSALELRPDSPEAFAGLHTTLVKARRAQRQAPAVPPAQPAPVPAPKIPTPAFATQTPASAPHPTVQPGNDAARTGRSLPPWATTPVPPAQQVAAQPPATAQPSAVTTRPAPPTVSIAVAGSIAAAPPPEQNTTTQQPAAPNAAAAPRPVQPASAAPAKEEVYGPFVPYVRPTPPQTRMAAIPSAGH